MRLNLSTPEIETLVARIEQGDIDLQPEFQRQEIWPRKKQKRLIDTIIRGWSIPPIHLIETHENRREVLDGQQRLAAIRDFLQNKFSIDGKITPHDDFVHALDRKFYRSLDKSVQRKINQYAISVFTITDYLPEEPSELFYRLNQPATLTAGEQRNALYGPAREQLKFLVSKLESVENIKKKLGFSNLRLAYDDVIARVLYFIEFGSFGVKGTETRISERFRQKDGFPDAVVKRTEYSIYRFLGALDYVGPIRFNKASLLSWLLFFSRSFDTFEPRFIDHFTDSKETDLFSVDLQMAKDLFRDRSSLRVTDVSSVVFRDFCLFYSYYKLFPGSIPEKIPTQYIELVSSDIESKENNDFEEVVSRNLSIDDWSQSI